MKSQILSDEKRKSIRADIYSSALAEKSDFADKKIAFFCKHAADKAVLDLGCIDHHQDNQSSRYWLHKAIKSVARSLVGLDYYCPGVDELNKQGYNIVCADAQNFQFDDKFDVVTAGDLIEHLPNLEGFFTSVYSALSDKGGIVLSTPNPWCWKYVLYHLIFKQLKPVNPEHVSWFCIQTLSNLCARFGFEIVEYEYSSRRFFERLIPLPKNIKHTTLCVYIRKSYETN